MDNVSCYSLSNPLYDKANFDGKDHAYHDVVCMDYTAFVS